MCHTVVKRFGSVGHLASKLVPKSKKHFFFRRILYHSNSIALFQLDNLALCGDVHPNPGFGNTSVTAEVSSGRKPPTWKYPCAICSKPVRSNQRGILCDGCCNWHHTKCIGLDNRTYRMLSSSDDVWYCTNCSFPFNFTDSFFEEPIEHATEITFQASPATGRDKDNAYNDNNLPSVLVLNARSIRNKVLDLHALLLTDSFDIVALTETWLDQNYLDCELQLEGYNIYRKDWGNRRGGGVLIAVRNHIICTHRSDLEVEAEMIALEIRPNPTTCVLFCVFYKPPGTDESFLIHFRDFLVQYSRTGLTNLIVTGDFNFPNIDWNLGCSIDSNSATEDFCNILDDFFLIQKNLYSTRDSRNPGSRGSILDLVLTNNDFLVENVVVRPNAFDSDHHPLTFKLHARMRRPDNVRRKVYCYKRADFQGLKDMLQSIPWDVVTSDACINTSLDLFLDTVFSAIDQYIPQIKLKRRSRPPWINKEIMKLVRKKKRLWKRLKSSGSQDLFRRFKELRKKTKRLINHSYSQYLQSLSDKLQDNPKHFWSFHSMKSKTKRIPETVIYDNIHSTDLTSKVELFNDYFQSIYSKSSLDVNLTSSDVVNPYLLFNVTTSISEVQGILGNLDISKSPGVDNLPARILKTCAYELSIPLAHLFNLSLKSGVMPILWKSANITPVHKGNNRDSVENYRSISLLPISAKCLERIVHNAIYSHVSPYLSEWQHGFVKGRSCETQLVLTHHHWAKALDEGRQVDVAFLDFSKAFDRVSHPVLLQKLCGFGISGSILQWCESYLSQRQQRVVLEGVSSSWSGVSSGVPQGSLLGPLFFVIFISDLPEVVLPGNCIALYADDCKSSRIINSASDQSMFQEDLDNLHRWSLRNVIDFNVRKCKIMRITKKKQPFISNYLLDNSVLEEVNEFRDLGITTDQHLCWNLHIDKVVAKANRMLGLIKRSCRDFNDRKTLRTLYCALVRSNLEYCSVIWSPYTKRGIEKIEKIQNRATKFILRSDDCYADRLKELNLLSLEKRRLLADLTFLYKALHGIIDIDVEPYVDFYKESDHYSFRHNDKLTLRMRYARTNVFKYSFFNRVVKTWNSLPLSIREATSVNTFKALVRKFFMD